MSNGIFEIDNSRVDVEAIVREIREKVAARLSAGEFSDLQITRAERLNLHALLQDGEYLAAYLKNLRQATQVDLSEFAVSDRSAPVAFLAIPFKRVLWKVLRFYTHRLWSQQNRTNQMIATALEGMHHRLNALERRITELESRSAAGPEA